MMNRRTVSGLFGLALASLVCLIPNHMAMARVGLRISAGGSATFPQGEWNDDYDTGYRGQMALTVIPAGSPVRFRITESYSHYDSPPPFYGTGSLSLSGVQFQVLWSPFTSSPIQPYVCAGYGAYYVHTRRKFGTATVLFDSKSSYHTDDAVDAGLGIEIPWRRMALSVETTYFRVVSTDAFESLNLAAGVSYALLQ